MTRRAARVLLFLLLAAAMIGAAAFIAREEAGAAPWRDAARRFDLEAARAQQALADVRVSQLALTAPGQSDRWWHNTLVSTQQAASSSLEVLRRTGTDPVSLQHLGLAGDALETLEQAGAHAAELADGDRVVQAAELVLSDGLTAAATASRHLEVARQAERQAADLRLAALRLRQVYAATAVALLSLLVALMLVPGSAAAQARSVDALPPAAGVTTAPAHLVAPPLVDVHVVTDADVAARDVAQAAPVAPLRPPAPGTEAVGDAGPAREAEDAWPARDRRKAPELRAAADLCTDFARLLDGQELPALLERASRLLDASGLIVWIADPSQQELHPVLAHGYTAQALARLPAIPRDADNATAAAFRGSQVEVVKTNGMSPGAVVVPLLAGQGCIGVMAAEVRRGREASESARALARIVAAQLATLVSIVPADEAARPLQQAVK